MAVLRYLWVADCRRDRADVLLTMREPAWPPHLADDQTFLDAV